MKTHVSNQTAFPVRCTECDHVFGYQESRVSECPACGSDPEYHVTNAIQLWDKGDFVAVGNETAKVLSVYRDIDDIYYSVRGTESGKTATFTQNDIINGIAKL